MNKKIHILFLITSLQYGGAERVVSNLSRSFSHKGYRVSVMLLEKKSDFSISNSVDVASLHSRQRDWLDKTLSVILDPFRLKRFIIENGVDIVLSFMQRPNAINMLSKALGSGHMACVNVRCSMKVHYKDIPLFIRYIGRLVFKHLWRYADTTIVNSHVIEDEIMDLFNIDPQTVDVVYNPLELGEIERLSKEGVSEDWFRDKESPIIINVGMMARAKGQEYLLRAFAALTARRKARLVIIGEGELKGKLLKEIEDLKLNGKVLLMGYRENPYKYVARSDVFVLSSIYEGFPNVLLEAMACHCPVVSTYSFSGPTEILLPQGDDRGDIIEAKYGILVKEPKETLLSQAIEYLLDNKDLAKRYAEVGFSMVSKFDISFISRDYERVLLKTLERRR